MSEKEKSDVLTPLKATVDTQSDELLTPQEAAAILELAPQTLANMRSTGRGPSYVKFGKRTIRYWRSALMSTAAEGTIRPNADNEIGGKKR